MQIDNQFTVAAPIDKAWNLLTDIPTIAPCLPGAVLTGAEGDTYEGKVKVKVGPITAEYKGTAEFIEKDDDAHRALIKAKGRDARGAGMASAAITAQLTEAGEETLVEIDTDLQISGKVAQFGRGVIVDVSEKLLGQFTDCLANKLAALDDVDEVSDAAEADTAGAASAAADTATAGTSTAAASPVDADTGVAAEAAGSGSSAGDAPVRRTFAAEDAEPEVEALDLMDVAGGAMMKRLLPVVVVAVIVAVILFLVL